LAKRSFTWFEKRHRTDALNLAQEQITKALDTATLLHKAIESASEGKKEEAKGFLEKLSKQEEEVDNLRRSVFKELTNVAISLEFREDLMHLVKGLDVMADHVKDSARSVMVLLETNIPKEIWDVNVGIAKALVQSTTTLRNSIEKLGSDPIAARKLAQEVNTIEERIDEHYLSSKKLLIRHTRQIDPGTLLILDDLVEFMEEAADKCADTADYIVVLTAER